MDDEQITFPAYCIAIACPFYDMDYECLAVNSCDALIFYQNGGFGYEDDLA